MKKFNISDVLVVMALKDEGGAALEKMGAQVVYTGLGKINATYFLSKAIQKYQPKLVVNFGTAGSKLFKQGEFVAATRFLQRDMDVVALGFKKYQTPFENTPIYIEFNRVFENLPHGTVGTGDSFETNHNHDRGEVVDMEAYALAKVCKFEQVEFCCVKFISDGADNNAITDWQESVKQANERFTTIFKSIVQETQKDLKRSF